ncbi:Inactive serine/threonine-protein kinase VRK3 [Camelus dromedarius]|uniref:Inactive serine/threonine-protein kinase VRK3 n=1 Tax=Camelus dromedarius TaxID=9838 RepID=A0A5N4DU60_CAMDR|nr:Inactive serine/threonine-protein kinase VRK3 [Camelus dromedarius]
MMVLWVLAYQLLDALEFLHENEYVHGNVTAESIFVNPEDPCQVTLAGYGFTFRYSPGGRHVAYSEGSRSPHEGDLEFISMDLHKGCETLQEYLKVVMALKYEEKPPYTALRNSLEALLQDLRVSAYDPLDLQMAP